MSSYIEAKKLLEDMSQDGLLAITKSSLGFKIEVVPSKESFSGVIEFCNSGTRHRDRKIHTLLINLFNLLNFLEEDDEARKIKIKIGSDGDIRVFVTQEITDKLPNLDFIQEFSFLKTYEKYSNIVLALDDFFESK